MSAFVCGHAEFSGESNRERVQNRERLKAIARRAGLKLLMSDGNDMPPIVEEILRRAMPSVPADIVPIMFATPSLPDVSDELIDADNDMLDRSVSARQAIKRRIAPLVDTIQEAFRCGVLRKLILITSVGVDDSYPTTVVSPTQIADALIDAYEREGQVPSLCLVVVGGRP